MENKIAKRYRLCSNCSYRIASGKCNGKCKEYWKYVGATEQKAIDDEESLKLESIWVKEAQINHDDVANYKQGYRDAVEKACEWLKNYLQEYGIILFGHWESDFRKAMEK